MRHGAVAMIDALGFKGIWDRNGVSPDAVLDKLRGMRDAAAAHQYRRVPTGHLKDSVPEEYDILDKAELCFLSDTIVIAVPASPESEKQTRTGHHFSVLYHFHAIRQLAAIVSDVLRSAAQGAPVLAYRGCMAVGDFIVEQPFVIGPAVDEAATHMDRAQGAFTWLAPSAEDAWDRCLNTIHFSRNGKSVDPISTSIRYGLVPYSVPLKGGDSYQTYVVSPFDEPFSSSEAGHLHLQIQQTFQGPLDVQVKRQNTLSFLAKTREVLQALAAQDTDAEATGSSSNDSGSESPP